MNIEKILVIAAGLFFGNWIVVPLIFERPFSVGFHIGLIAAILVLLGSFLIKLVLRLI